MAAGPKKLGPRPDDFDESSIRASPTFKRWLLLSPGQELLYSNRSFIRGGGGSTMMTDDEERLMRRIMIRRRANKREHDCLIRARKEIATTASATAASSSSSLGRSKRGEEIVKRVSDHSSSSLSTTTTTTTMNIHNHDNGQEMDMDAVVSTRSYRRWLALPNGATFVYNHTYIKGKEGQDWLLRKNIWRRMRYRRENQWKALRLKHK